MRQKRGQVRMVLSKRIQIDEDYTTTKAWKRKANTVEEATNSRRLSVAIKEMVP